MCFYQFHTKLHELQMPVLNPLSSGYYLGRVFPELEVA
jgi:hypothetical protein